MSSPEDHRPQRDEKIERDEYEVRLNWIHRRREKIYQEIMANRRGEYRVPTWVLATVLVLIVGAWVALLIIT